MSISITSVGPTPSTFSALSANHSASGRILSLAVAGDGSRMYAGSYAGVWRSDDGGQHWRQLTRPQPPAGEHEVPGAIQAPHIFDLAVSPVDPDVVLAAANRDDFTVHRQGIYRSTDGGDTWELVFSDFLFVTQIIFAPDDPLLAYAATGLGIAVSRDAGQTWESPFNRPPFTTIVSHVAAGPLEGSGIRRVYAAGDDEVYYSTDGGTTWSVDQGAATLRNALTNTFAGQLPDGVGSGAHVLAVEPGNPTRVYLAAVGGANGPSYYAVIGGVVIPDGHLCNAPTGRGCGEGSLWYGDFDQFATTGAAQWSQLPGPPVYFGVTTPSGNAFVVAKPTGSGHLLFFADQSHVHVSDGKPTATSSWHRLDGKDASETAPPHQYGNQLFVHADPHYLVTSTDFDIALTAPTGVAFPYDQNSVLDQHLAGTIWMANDGGVDRSDDGGRTWRRSVGLDTLDPVNIAGLAGLGSRPALYMGTGDNDDFFTRDGGGHWGDPISSCGDCDAWFADPAQSVRVLEFNPRDGDERKLRLISGGFVGVPPRRVYPDAAALPAIATAIGRAYVPDLGVAYVGEVRHLGAAADLRVLDLDERAGLRPLPHVRVRP